MTVEKHQAAMLATLAIAMRPYGARQWDHAGVMAAIGKVAGLQLADVACAVARAAADRTLETPAAIGNTTSSAWRERVAEQQRPNAATPTTACKTCGKPMTGECCDNPTDRPGHAAPTEEYLAARRARRSPR